MFNAFRIFQGLKPDKSQHFINFPLQKKAIVLFCTGGPNKTFVKPVTWWQLLIATLNNDNLIQIYTRV